MHVKPNGLAEQITERETFSTGNAEGGPADAAIRRPVILFFMVVGCQY